MYILIVVVVVLLLTFVAFDENGSRKTNFLCVIRTNVFDDTAARTHSAPIIHTYFYK